MRSGRHQERVRKTLGRVTRAVAGRLMRWRGHPPEEAGVPVPRRPRPTLPTAAVALAEPPAVLRRRPRIR
jgi:hypothetical protein